MFFLANILTYKLNLKTSVVKSGISNQWNINIHKATMKDLASIVGEHIIPEMRYKLEGYL